MCLTSARDITEAVNPPRAVFLDFPLGHTSGRVGDAELNRRIVTAALNALSGTDPGLITDLPVRWADDDAWKDKVMRVSDGANGSKQTEDDRVQRFETPQYQSSTDADAAASSHDGEQCLVCAGIDF